MFLLNDPQIRKLRRTEGNLVQFGTRGIETTSRTEVQIIERVFLSELGRQIQGEIHLTSNNQIILLCEGSNNRESTVYYPRYLK